MVKSKEQLLAKGKAGRKAHKEENAGLKLRKNWYPVTDLKKHFERKDKVPKKSHVQHQLKLGQVLILLSGRFRGRRVVFLKRLESGLLLVTGPYKINGVPLKRVNQAYVIPTSTIVKIDKLPAEVESIKEDKFFTKVKIERNEKDFFEEPAAKKARISKERVAAQLVVDTVVKKGIDAVPMLKEYLRARFALKNGDKPHLMKF